jgi:hypothetical protein
MPRYLVEAYVPERGPASNSHTQAAASLSPDGFRSYHDLPIVRKVVRLLIEVREAPHRNV